MAFLDILRSRKREEVKPKRLPRGALKQIERPTKKPAEFKTHITENKGRLLPERKQTTSGLSDKNTGPHKNSLAALILIEPHITERATSLSRQNIYTFHVSPSANKILIKKAVQEMYGFEPIKIRITKAMPKKRFTRGKYGTKPGFKKALIYLKESDKIEFL